MEDPKADKEMKELSKTPTWDFNDRGQFKYLKQCQGNLESYSPTDIALESDFVFWTSQVKQVLRKLESLKVENNQIPTGLLQTGNRVAH